MKKRVGIITFHNAINFGAVLQCYALQKKLLSMGFDAKVVDYRNEFIQKEYSLFGGKLKGTLKTRIIEIIKRILGLPMNYLKIRLFKKFINENFNLTEKHTYETLNSSNDLDILITGSDQVWNKDLTGGINQVYLLDVNQKFKKYSYAASIGKDNISYEEAKQIADIVKSYNGITVRETSLKHALEKAGLKKIDTVLDPVFLLDKEEWQALAGKRMIKDKYILVYMMEYNENIKQIVDKISESTGFKIVTFNKLNRYENILANKYISGPKEFLNYINNAELVITNSFHATAFSIIFQKDFYTIKHSNKNSRIDEILTKFALTERIIENIKDIQAGKLNSHVDYSKVQETMFEKQREAINFLNTINEN